MTDANDFINPCTVSIKDGKPSQNIVGADLDVPNYGLTKREYFAAMAMQGILANVDIINWNNSPFEEGFVAKISTKMADALIEQLNK